MPERLVRDVNENTAAQQSIARLKRLAQGISGMEMAVFILEYLIVAGVQRDYGPGSFGFLSVNSDDGASLLRLRAPAIRHEVAVLRPHVHGTPPAILADIIERAASLPRTQDTLPLIIPVPFTPSFPGDLTTQQQWQQIGLLLPAIQKVRDAAAPLDGRHHINSMPAARCGSWGIPPTLGGRPHPLAPAAGQLTTQQQQQQIGLLQPAIQKVR